MKTLTRYVAEDGTIFDSKEECELYEEEENITDTLSESKDIAFVDYDEDLFPYEINTSDTHYYRWYKILTDKGLRLFPKVLKEYNVENEQTWVKNKWYCIETNEYDDSAWVTTLDDVKEQYYHTLEILDKYEAKAKR